MVVWMHWDVDYVFAGHVHGGEVILPFVGGLVWTGSGMAPREIAGIVFFGKWREDTGFIEGTWNE